MSAADSLNADPIPRVSIDTTSPVCLKEPPLPSAQWDRAAVFGYRILYEISMEQPFKAS